MTTKIDKKIVGYKVIVKGDKPEEPNQEIEIDLMHEGLSRPEILLGSTYKVKTPQENHALYVTINDIILNEGTEHEERRPYEIFINSKNMEHYQWGVALTRLVSAVFRKGGGITFLVEELKGIFDPKGGYFKKGGVFVPSLVAEIGLCLELHMITIGIIKKEIDENQKLYLLAKRKEFEAMQGVQAETTEFPAQAVLCVKCNVKALVLMDGCMTCLNCGDSKCG
ncbi:MAG TPA: hypothetical protein VFM18_21240 [Methanosarcina sp.]|nr:hypothetical protein [Methanosarcina sp.]